MLRSRFNDRRQFQLLLFEYALTRNNLYALVWFSYSSELPMRITIFVISTAEKYFINQTPLKCDGVDFKNYVRDTYTVIILIYSRVITIVGRFPLLNRT